MINNKGNISFRAIGGISLLIYIVITLFLGFTIFAISYNNMMIPLWNVTDRSNYSTTISDANDESIQWYRDLNLSFMDYIAVAVYFSYILGTLILAYYTPADGQFNAIYFLMYGILISSFIAGLLITLVQWFYYDFFWAIFESSFLVNLPLFNLVFPYIGVIFIGHSCLMWLANQYDFNFSERQARKNKEIQSLYDNDNE